MTYSYGGILYLDILKISYYECLLTTPNLTHLIVPRKKHSSWNSLLTFSAVKAIMDAKIFSPPASTNAGNAQCRKNYRFKFCKTQPPLLSFTHTCMYTFVHKHVLCTFKAINQRSRSMYSYHLTPDGFFTPISEIMGRCIILKGKEG